VSLIFFKVIFFSFEASLHAGISTFEGRLQSAIPQSAFLDAVNEYVNKSETDDDGSYILAE
jgi:hypothetical protein